MQLACVAGPRKGRRKGETRCARARESSTREGSLFVNPPSPSPFYHLPRRLRRSENEWQSRGMVSWEDVRVATGFLANWSPGNERGGVSWNTFIAALSLIFAAPGLKRCLHVNNTASYVNDDCQIYHGSIKETLYAHLISAAIFNIFSNQQAMTI